MRGGGGEPYEQPDRSSVVCLLGPCGGRAGQHPPLRRALGGRERRGTARLAWLGLTLEAALNPVGADQRLAAEQQA
jgi:hypothetical protein